MKKIVKKLINKYAMNEKGNINRKKAGYIAGYSSIFSNFVLTGVKIVFGLISGSLSLMADGIHSLSDVITSIVVIIGFKVSSKPPDKKHPFGHGRFEAVATLIIAIVLFTIGVEFFESGIKRINKPVSIKFNWIIIAVISGTIIIKELTAQFAKYLGREINSKAIEADFWHHRSDTLSSIFVLIGAIGSLYGVFWLDGLAAILVSLMLLWVSITLARETVNTLLGEPPSEELLNNIKRLAFSHNKVEDIHDVIVHQYGDRLLVSLHIEVKDKYSAMQLHDISEEVEDMLEEKIHIADVTIHADPVNMDHKLYNPVHKILEQQINKIDGFISFHDLRIVGGEYYPRVVFDIEVGKSLPAKKIRQIERDLKQIIYDKLKIKATVKTEEIYKYQVD